jgi:hypothetical protein
MGYSPENQCAGHIRWLPLARLYLFGDVYLKINVYITLAETMNAISEKDKLAYCRGRGVTPEHHCCSDMAYAVAHPVEIEHQGRNRVVDWISSWNEYRIPVAYDGYSSTLMKFCPFCGAKLGESKQTLWYETLYSLGFHDPGEQDHPKKFNTDQWWRGANR